MIIRRKIFSIVEIDGEERIFSTNELELEQRDFAKRGQKRKGNKGKQSRKNSSTSTPSTSSAPTPSTPSKPTNTSTPSSTPSKSVSTSTSSVITPGTSSATKDVAKSGGKFAKYIPKSTTGKVAAGVGAATALAGTGLAIAKVVKNRRKKEKELEDRNYSIIKGAANLAKQGISAFKSATPKTQMAIVGGTSAVGATGIAAHAINKSKKRKYEHKESMAKIGAKKDTKIAKIKASY